MRSSMIFVAVTDFLWISLDDLNADSVSLGEGLCFCIETFLVVICKTPHFKHDGENACLLQGKLLAGKNLRKPVWQPWPRLH